MVLIWQSPKDIAEENGMEAQIENMEFDSLIVALQNGQVDAVIAGMTVTDERAEAVDFSTPYYTATQVMVVKDGSDITKKHLIWKERRSALSRDTQVRLV